MVALRANTGNTIDSETVCQPTVSGQNLNGTRNKFPKSASRALPDSRRNCPFRRAAWRAGFQCATLNNSEAQLCEVSPIGRRRSVEAVRRAGLFCVKTVLEIPVHSLDALTQT
jgi:hypothetical protein